MYGLKRSVKKLRWIGIISMVDQYLQLFWNIVEQYLWVNQRGLISTVQSGLVSMLHIGTISMGLP